MSWLTYDEATRIGEKLHEDDGSLIIERIQDAGPVVERNKYLYAGVDERTRWDDLSWVASIPVSVYFALPKDLRNDPKALMRWLDDPEQRCFRTRPGRLR